MTGECVVEKKALVTLTDPYEKGKPILSSYKTIKICNVGKILPENFLLLRKGRHGWRRGYGYSK